MAGFESKSHRIKISLTISGLTIQGNVKTRTSKATMTSLPLKTLDPKGIKKGPAKTHATPPKTPPPDLKTTSDRKNDMIIPRVGGVIEISEKEVEAFTGGSNLEVPPDFHECDLQRHPLKLGNSKMFHDAVNNGTPCKLAEPDAKQQDQPNDH